MLDELCAMTGWQRSHARKALKAVLTPRVMRAPKPWTPRYRPKVVEVLVLCWAVLGAPAGKRLKAVIAELVGTLRRFGELAISDEVDELLVGMSAVTMDGGWPRRGRR
jgi:hypothetical protein